ncbi:hypothetical protein [Luteimonas sp. RC10]|uniref:ABC transporter substrate-binding protein n=1 Tax=Luteimonas sp. RC10 TaxID=2587035 RepID=UPI0017F7FEF9|nr:hypothetical protein [Luteimonas sp. RC10]MBB3343507.1 NitT/TauT family transport system substrate-binding protein [Luteimonas sp. RC10]
MRISLVFGIAQPRASWRATALTLLLMLLLSACKGPADAPPDVDMAGNDAPLRLAGPGAVVSFPLMRMAQTGIATADGLRPVRFALWHSPDQLRVLMARGELDYSAAPANLPALMRNRGEPVRLLNVSVWGLLWLVSRDADVHDLDDLRGQTLLTPFRRDMGAIVLHALLDARDLQPERDLQLRQTRDGLDAVTLMLADQGDHALLPEPTASLLLHRNAERGGAPLYRVQSVETAWAQTFPRQPELPQAGVMASARMAGDAALGDAVVAAYADAARWCKADPPACAALAHTHLPQMPVEALEQSIRVTRLDGLPAASVRPQLEALYALLLDGQPETIGGRLPDPAFYGP